MLRLFVVLFAFVSIVSCGGGPFNGNLEKNMAELDKKYGETKDKLGNIGENKLLLITTIQLIDEYFDLQQRVSKQKEKISPLKGFRLKVEYTILTILTTSVILSFPNKALKESMYRKSSNWA